MSCHGGKRKTHLKVKGEKCMGRKILGKKDRATVKGGVQPQTQEKHRKISAGRISEKSPTALGEHKMNKKGGWSNTWNSHKRNHERGKGW